MRYLITHTFSIHFITKGNASSRTSCMISGSREPSATETYDNESNGEWKLIPNTVEW